MENIYMEKVEAGHAGRIMEIDPEVLYQWRSLVPTYVERLTRIRGLHMKNITAKSANAVYELKGDIRLNPAFVEIENVTVDSVSDFIGRITNVDSVFVNNITVLKQPSKK